MAGLKNVYQKRQNIPDLYLMCTNMLIDWYDCLLTSIL